VTMTPVATPLPVSTPEPTPLPPPPTPAPEPTFAPTRGRGEAAMRTAQAAFARGDYDTALAQAQKALTEQPDQADARKLVDSAINGRKANERFRVAEAALSRGDFAEASREAEAGRLLAPWDNHGPDLLTRAQAGQERVKLQAQQRQQTQATERIASLLNRADEALSAQKYDLAIDLYEEVLKLDPQNAPARLGRTGATTARATAQAAAAGAAPRPVAPPSKSFVSGKTSAQSAEANPGGSVPVGFEESSKVTARRGTQAAQLPGRIVFEVKPDPVRPGERYSVTVALNNEGGASIPIKDMTVTTTVNGRRAGGPVQPLVAEVAPRQKAVLLSQDGVWKEEYTSWSMEVTVRTVRGETYRNQVTWR
jgi:tetratricopeptide (TPR) repeat protein